MAKFKLGLFENRFVDVEKISQKIFTTSHRFTALETARKGIVLLKNSNLLPLNKLKTPKKILVTGPNANNQSILGDWHAAQPEENVTTIYEGIKELGESKGYKVSLHNSGENIRKISDVNIQKTLEASKDADYVVVVVGDNSMRYKWKDKTAGENMDRAKLNLAGKQLKLVKSLKKINKNIIVVYVN